MLTINVSSWNVPIKRFTSMPRIHCISFRSFLQLKYIRNITSTVFQFIIPTYVLHQLGNSLSYFFYIYSTRFNEIFLFLSTVPKGTSTSRREMGSWAFWHTVWPRSTVFTACEKARCAYSFDHCPKTRTTRLFGLYWWMGGIQANAKGLGFQSLNG